jgi:hypothetical protein
MARSKAESRPKPSNDAMVHRSHVYMLAEDATKQQRSLSLNKSAIQALRGHNDSTAIVVTHGFDVCYRSKARLSDGSPAPVSNVLCRRAQRRTRASEQQKGAAHGSERSAARRSNRRVRMSE